MFCLYSLSVFYRIFYKSVFLFFSHKDNEWAELQIWKERERLETPLLEKCYQKKRLVPR